jgi:hypothetical protein
MAALEMTVNPSTSPSSGHQSSSADRVQRSPKNPSWTTSHGTEIPDSKMADGTEAASTEGPTLPSLSPMNASNVLSATEATVDDGGSDSPATADGPDTGNPADIQEQKEESNKDNKKEDSLSLTVDTSESEPSTTSVIDFSKSVRWSEALKSPMVPAFSPSLNPNRPGSLHGLGMPNEAQHPRIFFVCACFSNFEKLTFISYMQV